MKRYLTSALLLLALMPVYGYAQGAPPGGGTPTVTKQHVFGNVSYGIVLSGKNTDQTDIIVEDQKLSGTKVELNVRVGSGYVAAPPGGTPQVTKASVSNIEVYILGTSSADDVLPGQSPPHGVVAGGAGTYRLATTYFQHNDEIRVRARCTFTFTYYVGGVLTSEEVLYDDYLKFKAYNVLQTAGTGDDSDGAFNSTFFSVSEDAVEWMQAFATASGVNHSKNPNSVSVAMGQTASNIRSQSTLGTVMLAVLHGISDPNLGRYIADSDFTSPSLGQPPSSTDFFTPEEISIARANKATDKVPLHNLVFYWACETLAAGPGLSWPVAYGIASPDRAHVGFSDSILLQCWTEEDWDTAQGNGFSDPYAAGIAFSADVADNVAIVLDHLAIGDTILAAKAVSHNQVPMVRVGGSALYKLAAAIEGDFDTRIKYVYFSFVEAAAMAAASRSIDVFLVKHPIG